jgi:hypothetical protein
LLFNYDFRPHLNAVEKREKRLGFLFDNAFPACYSFTLTFEEKSLGNAQTGRLRANPDGEEDEDLS